MSGVPDNHEVLSGVGGVLEALAGRCGAAVVALADQPLVGPESVRRLVHAWEGGAEAAVATYGGVWAHPVLLHASVWAPLSEGLTGDRARARGLRCTAIA